MTVPLLFTLVLLSACSPEPETTGEEKDHESAKAYWYNNEAEISSYALSQARYGEIREGKAVLIYVTEPFSPQKFTKSDNPSDKDVSVLKLNATKNFNTGIYPYSMMTSTFFPFSNGKHSLKISSSSQEWCGHTYMELRNEKKFTVQVSSYFEGESKKDLTLEKELLEDDFWSVIRLSPDQLPTGNIQVIPSFFYLRLLHKEMKAYACNVSQTMIGDTNVYTLDYPDLERSLSISFEKSFPYKILAWSETYYSGWGDSRKKLTTHARRIETVKTDYWNRNSNKDHEWRVKLGLE